MAGIGFSLQKLFEEDYYTSRAKAYMYSAIISAGPWIAAVITVNLILFISGYYFDEVTQRNLFMGTIVYSFVFSQILTAPWQFLITRYISDMLYSSDYKSITSSFKGLSKLIGALSLIIGSVFYINTDLPVYYKLLALSLFMVISLLWIVMVYLSAIKDYAIISYAYIGGGAVSVLLTLWFYKYPLGVGEYSVATSILFAYLVGIVITYGVLLYSFLIAFVHENNNEFDFLRYLSKYTSLFLIGLFYTLGLWIDDIIMWYSDIGVDIYNTYRYAPLYDNAIFLAYLTVIPTMILFMVQIETEFYVLYKEYFGLATKRGTFDEIELARVKLKSSAFRQLIYTMETQITISLTVIFLSGIIFSYFSIPLIVRDIFRIATLGALCNIFILVIILILLYFEGKKESIMISLSFLSLNALLTFIFIPHGVDFYGVGYFLASFTTLIFALILLEFYMGDINYHTFGRQPAFNVKDTGFLVDLSEFLNKIHKSRKKKMRFNIIASVVVLIILFASTGFFIE